MSDTVSWEDIEATEDVSPSESVGTPQHEDIDVSAVFDYIRLGRAGRGSGAGILVSYGIYGDLSEFFKIDLSSVYPCFEPKTRTSLIEQVEKGIPSQQTLEYDVYVPMPPVTEFTVRAKVVGMREAIPRSIEP